MPPAAEPEPAPEPVSIHAPRCRGAMPNAPVLGRPKWEVSIHAPRCRGAMPAAVARYQAGKQFQSTPPVAEGRCPPINRRSLFPAKVSIHAPRCRGAMPGFHGRLAELDGVSIHAPRCRGAMPRLEDLPGVFVQRFNPRPPLPRGDASICYRVSHVANCFNPRPPLPRGDARHLHPQAQRPRRFNPRPPLPRGDAFSRHRQGTQRQGFNPRPPLPRGDAVMEIPFIDDVCVVSIHAPRCRGAMPAR